MSMKTDETKLKRRPAGRSDSDTVVVWTFSVFVIGLVWSLISIFFHDTLETPAHKALVLFVIAAVVALIVWRLRRRE